MLQNFGTVLSKEQMKLVKGGDQTLEIPDDNGLTTCYSFPDKTWGFGCPNPKICECKKC